MITFTFEPGVDHSYSAEIAALWDAEQAWRRWEMESCIERNGTHLWQAEVFPIEDDEGGLHIWCDYCHATVDDIMPDGIDVTFGDVGGVRIEHGMHESHEYWTGPVSVKIETRHYPANPSHGEEWDAWVEIEEALA